MVIGLMLYNTPILYIDYGNQFYASGVKETDEITYKTINDKPHTKYNKHIKQHIKYTHIKYNNYNTYFKETTTNTTNISNTPIKQDISKNNNKYTY